MFCASDQKSAWHLLPIVTVNSILSRLWSKLQMLRQAVDYLKANLSETEVIETMSPTGTAVKIEL